MIIAFFIYRKKNTSCTFFFVCLFIIYILFLIRITILPITILDEAQLNRIHSSSEKYIQYYQIIPFKTILNVGSYNFFRQVICNILMFIPLPIFVKIAKKEMKGWKIILIGILISLSIELIQLFTNIITRYPTHVCDIDDLILNSMGTIIGYIIIIILNKIPITNQLIKSIVYKKQ
jgi:glycopeptide antibiotics resistance protein